MNGMSHTDGTRPKALKPAWISEHAPDTSSVCVWYVKSTCVCMCSSSLCTCNTHTHISPSWLLILQQPSLNIVLSIGLEITQLQMSLYNILNINVNRDRNSFSVLHIKVRQIYISYTRQFKGLNRDLKEEEGKTQIKKRLKPAFLYKDYCFLSK